MRLRRKGSTPLSLILLAVSALVLAACGGGDDADTGATEDETEEDTTEEDTTEDETEEDTTEEDETEEDTTEDETDGDGNGDGEGDGAAAPEDVGTLNIGFIPWDEAIAVTNLWEHILEEEGYDVEQTQLEVGGLYQGLAEGELDLFMDAWLPATHSDYWEEFGEDINEVGVWFEEAPLTWTVPSYMEDINSIEDLQGNADMFDGEIIGIEPGAGLTRVSQEDVIPTYELGDNYTLVEGSTPAMLSELESAIQNEENIVVTLWHPHWAYGEWDLKDLEDPENALGDPDEIRIVSRSGLPDDAPQVTEWMSNFEMSLDELSELEVMINDADDPLTAAEEWASENQDRVDEWLGN